MFFLSKEPYPKDKLVTLALTNCYQLLMTFTNLFMTDLKPEASIKTYLNPSLYFDIKGFRLNMKI